MAFAKGQNKIIHICTWGQPYVYNPITKKFIKVKGVLTCTSLKQCKALRKQRISIWKQHIHEQHDGPWEYEDLHTGYVANRSWVNKTLPELTAAVHFENNKLGGFALSTTPFKNSKSFYWEVAVKEFEDVYVHGYQRRNPARLEMRRGSSWSGLENKCEECKPKRKHVYFGQNDEDLDTSRDAEILTLGDKLIQDGTSEEDAIKFVKNRLEDLYVEAIGIE